jgi:RluA family pseudouridine synthase
MPYVLHLDDRLLVIDKPSGLSLATPRSNPDGAVTRLLDLLDVEQRAALGPAPRLVHRLDVGTSGVVVLTRTPASHRQLIGLFQSRRVEKVYWALAWGRPKPSSGTLDVALGPDRKDRRKMRVDPAGSPARTHYRVLGVGGSVSWLELRPETGRTHQIRVHLAAIGHPIVGDDLYGGPRHHGIRAPELRRALSPEWTLLHARALAFEDQRFEAPLPAPFTRALKAAGITE